MIDGKLLVEKLLRYAEAFLHLNPRDEIYMRNLLLREFKLDEPYKGEEDISFVETLDVPDTLVSEIEQYAEENALAEEGEYNLYSTYIMGILSPLPSKVNEEFYRLKQTEGIEKACRYFYDLSVKNNYIQKTAIGRNLWWKFDDGDRYLEITVNLSKPEKNNKDIAKLLTAPKKAKYPACLLCKENEGYKGTLTHPARENIRTVSVKLAGEPWFVQYSPYAYYNEHLIAISENHVPMNVNPLTVRKVLDFVDIFPNYMIGSNASLPIVGGSILDHEHFQGGEHLMPMHKAGIKKSLTAVNYPDVKVGVVDWYNSVIRMESENKESLIALGGEIVSGWKTYSDAKCDIIAVTEDGVIHNTLSPIARKSGNKYILDMIFRNNRTSEEYPDGIFHAHPEYHNIKKEGIGLIEAMGLFILPGRLKKQLSMIADILCKNAAYDEAELKREDNYLYVHRNMIKDLVGEGYSDTFEEAEKRVTDRVNNVCKNILKNTAVFKDDENGERGFSEFLSSVGIK